MFSDDIYLLSKDDLKSVFAFKFKGDAYRIDFTYLY